MGHNKITINNCSFSDNGTGNVSTIYDYNYSNSGEDYYYYYNSYEYFHDDSLKYRCDRYSCMDKIRIYYNFTNPEIHQTENNIYFLSCHFINNYRMVKLLHVEVDNNYIREVHTHVQSVTIHNCLFYFNSNSQLLSVGCDNKGGSRKYCVSALIDNTTISSNIHKHMYSYLIYAYYAILTFENTKVINNSVGIDVTFDIYIIQAQDSYVIYDKYNEISNNSADYVIQAVAVHINENSILNISFNVLTMHCAITSKEHADFEI